MTITLNAADNAAEEEQIAQIPHVEVWEMSELDFFAGLLRMAGRNVRVAYFSMRNDPEQIGIRASMKCWDRFPFFVEACLKPDGCVVAHGGNWIENESTLHEAIDLFVSSAPHSRSA
ncbi:hypothetical protein [Comamonas sp.]|uniref:hypothetical protein n=1 Tax=Comamonas sp. TaxID=34028 RepID=UPI0028A29612|nr:hypothetical protein [Comamonas sp.]